MTDLSLGMLLWSQAATWPEMLGVNRRDDIETIERLIGEVKPLVDGG